MQVFWEEEIFPTA